MVCCNTVGYWKQVWL